MKLIGIFIIMVSWVASPMSYGKTATALIEATQGQSQLKGTASFEETAEGLKIKTDLENAPVGDHAFHIHARGSCEDKGQAAGPHFNPDNTPHGFVPDDGLEKAHPGDLGNIGVGDDGQGHLELTVPGLALSEGKYAVEGKAVVVHANPDSFEQPDGKGGERIGCGVIHAD